MQHYPPKLTPNEDRVWELLEAGVFAQDVAEKIGVNGSVLSVWLHRKNRRARWDAVKKSLRKKRYNAQMRKHRLLRRGVCGSLRGPSLARQIRLQAARLAGQDLRALGTYARHPDVAARRAVADVMARPDVDVHLRRLLLAAWAAEPDPEVRALGERALGVWGGPPPPAPRDRPRRPPGRPRLYPPGTPPSVRRALRALRHE